MWSRKSANLFPQSVHLSRSTPTLVPVPEAEAKLVPAKPPPQPGVIGVIYAGFPSYVWPREASSSGRKCSIFLQVPRKVGSMLSALKCDPFLLLR